MYCSKLIQRPCHRERKPVRTHQWQSKALLFASVSTKFEFCLEARPVRLRYLFLQICFVTCLCFVFTLNGSMARGQVFAISSETLVSDEPPKIRVLGLTPKQEITLQAELVDGAGQRWSSAAEFLANEQGVIDLTAQAPLAGSYRGLSPAGLLWSMLPEEKGPQAYQAPHDLGSQLIELRVLAGGKQLAHGQLVQDALSPGIKQVRLTGQLHGTLFLPPGRERHPAVLVLGGSEGGAPTRRAAWLASHGYVSLALAYFHYENLPESLQSIPLEYFGQAIGFLLQRQEVLPEQLAVVGTSRGGELALQLGSMYPQLHSIVAYVPSNVRGQGCCGRGVGPAWTWKGQPLSYVRQGEGEIRAFDQHALIEVERTHGSILLISGQDDDIWPSYSMADSVMHRLRQSRFSYRFEHFTYAHAGHRAGAPALTPTWTGEIEHPISGRRTRYGGTPEGNAASTLDADPKVLAFLQQSLAAE